MVAEIIARNWVVNAAAFSNAVILGTVIPAKAGTPMKFAEC